MTIQQLKYILAVQKEGSITKAAEKLFMNQPNLSRNILELEESLGFSIFTRTAKGMIPTAKGEEVIYHAKRILSRVDAIEKISSRQTSRSHSLQLAVPRSSYIALAFTRLVTSLDKSLPIHMDYKETTGRLAIEDVADKKCNLGIIRYENKFQKNYDEVLTERKIHSARICSFRYHILVSVDSPLARLKNMVKEDLKDFIEVAYGEANAPSIGREYVKGPTVDRRINIYERGSQFSLLSSSPYTYTWAAPMPSEILNMYKLTVVRCSDEDKIFSDFLIYPESYSLTDIDNRFIDELYKAKRELFHSFVD